MVKNTALILTALLVDGLQATISWGIATIAAFPGTIGGGVAGCLAGDWVAGQIGCWVGGAVVGFFGTALNPILAGATIPIGFALGFAINMCISIVLGWFFLVPMMYGWGVALKWKRLVWGGGEMIPGLNNIPFWTALTIASLWNSAQTKSGRKGVLAFAGFASLATRPIIGMRERTGVRIERAKERGLNNWTGKQFPVNVASPEEWAPQPNTGKDLIRLGQSRPIMQDIRDIQATKPNAQTI